MSKRKQPDLSTREARRRIEAGIYHWRTIERGVAIGYYKSAEGGAWFRRVFNPATGQHPKHRLATCDDRLDADGVQVLSFAQAQRRILEQVSEKNTEALPATLAAAYTVRDAVHAYVDYMRSEKKSAADTETKLRAYVLSTPLAGKRVDDLTHEDLEEWRKSALKRKSRRNELADPSERALRKKNTVDRVAVALKAALTRAVAGSPAKRKASGKNRDAWESLRKLGKDNARRRFLTLEEATRLQNAAPADLRQLIAAGLHTGCRLGELLQLRAGDFDRRTRLLLIADSKSGKPRHVALTDEGAALFEELVAGKLESEAVFTRADGSPWYRVAISRGVSAACQAAKIRPAVSFHILRHTFASHLVQQKVPLLFVATALGHGDTRMVEKHYGHLAPSQVHDAIRAALPSFGSRPAGKVSDIRKRTHKA